METVGPRSVSGRRAIWPPEDGARQHQVFCVLMTLRDQPLHGYGIIKAIEDVSGHAPSAGVIYPTLQMLEDQGCVAMNEEDNRKIYVITDSGRRFLDEHRDTVERLRYARRSATMELASRDRAAHRGNFPHDLFQRIRTLMTRRQS